MCCASANNDDVGKVFKLRKEFQDRHTHITIFVKIIIKCLHLVSYVQRTMSPFWHFLAPFFLRDVEVI